MNSIRIIAAYLMLAFIGGSAFGQDCDSKLEEANRAYYNGEFKKLLELMEDCADKISTSEGNVEAYGLMAQAALMTEADSLAEKYLLQILKLDPFYKPKIGALKEFTEMHKKFEIRNFLTVGFMAGLNHSSFSILDYHSYASVTNEPASYEPNPGFNFNLWASYYLIYDFYLRAGLGFQQHEFYQEEIIFDYQSVSSQETYQYYNIPILLEYQFSKWKLKPFLNGGVSYQILNSARADIVNAPLEGGVPNPFAGVTRSLENYDISDLRTSGNWNMLLGGGLRYQMRYLSLEASVYYENGNNNLVDQSARYSDNTLYSDYSYISDDFKLRHVSFNLGLIYTFLKPIKTK